LTALRATMVVISTATVVSNLIMRSWTLSLSSSARLPPPHLISNSSSANVPPSPQWCTSGDDYFTGGRWVYNASIETYPYGMADDDGAPVCTATWHDYQATGVVPEFLKYQWQPRSCAIAPFDKINMCRLLHNQTIGLMGDSMIQTFAHSLMGKMLGYNDQVSTRVPLCPAPSPSPDDSNNDTDDNDGSSSGRGHAAKLIFVRWDNYWADNEESSTRAIKLLRESDVVIMNFGVHYTPNATYEKNMIDLVDTLKRHATAGQTLFWRSTIVSHAGDCGAVTRPDHIDDDDDDGKGLATPDYHIHDQWMSAEILRQDVDIAQRHWLNHSISNSRPAENRSNDASWELLRVDHSTLLRRDGQRVVGHSNASDCLHYCEPGPTDHWVDLLYHRLVLREQNIEWENNYHPHQPPPPEVLTGTL
jgi:GDSL/SGNH-like Acyl-Esterase family found in Pmr5 and Cas1p